MARSIVYAQAAAFKCEEREKISNCQTRFRAQAIEIMTNLKLDRRSTLLLAILPSLATGLLNQYWTESAYRAGLGWFLLADVMQWVVVPLLVWLLILKPVGTKPADLGLSADPFRESPVNALALVLFVAMVLWVAYEPVRAIAHRFFSPFGGTFGYGSVVPTGQPWRFVAVIYLSASAALVEEVVFRGLPWAYLCAVTSGRHRRFWYVAITSVLFAATHMEQGPGGLIATLSFGIAAATLYLALRNLWPLVFGHFVGDLVSFWPK